MSIIQNIRERGTWIIFGIITLALIAFILQDGVGRKGGSTDGATLGKVNGEVINKLEFEEKLDAQVQNYASQGVKREQLIGYLWSQEVDRLLFKSEEKKLGVTVGTKEISDVLFGNESPFKQEFTDKTTGEFKVNDAKQAIAQIKKSKNKDQVKQIEKFYIEPAIENRLRSKYQALVVKGVQLPKWLAEKQLAETSNVSSISYVGLPYSSVSDKDVKVTNDDIAAYLNENAAAFQIEETSKNIGFVGFSAAPSSADSASARDILVALKEDFKNTNDPAAFLNKAGTELPYYNSFLSKKSIMVPQKDSIFNVGVGNIYGPYVDGKNYTIAKVIGLKQWPDSASFRHILIGTINPTNGQQLRDDSSAKKLADSISNAIKGGASFDALCAQYSDDESSKLKGGVFPMFSQGQMVIPVNDFSFENPVGAKGVVKSEFGFHIMEVLKQGARGPAYKIAYLSKSILPSNETVTAASTAAAQFASTAKDLKSFNANAVKINKQVLPATGIKANDFEIPGVGTSRATVRWIFDNNVNAISEPLEVGDSYFVAAITGEDKEGLASVEAAKPQVEGIIRDKKKAEKIKNNLKGNSLEAIAANAKASIQKADSINFNYSMIAGLGNEPKIAGAAFNKSLINKLSEPIAANSGVFVITVNSLGAKQAEQDPAFFKDELLQRTRSVLFRTSVALKKTATIVDNRSKLY
ncbi:MAG: peptidylprolyl isomerase [Bacteroidetes bacterium]|nr:peptidylprolyl isomerase [Bacteroidota bacterium]